MKSKAYLAFDLGAESGRAMLGVLQDGKLSLHELHRFANLPVRLPSGLHWNLLDLWSHLVTGLRKAVVHARENGLDLVSLGVDTWGVDFGLIGASGELLGLPFAYRNERNTRAMEKTLATLGAGELYRRTGISSWFFNTLFQLAAQRDSEPCLLQHAQRLLFMPDLLHYFFTGRCANEASIASTSQLLDPRTGLGTWATDLLAGLDIPSQMLGELVAPGTILGPLRPELAAEVGTPEGLKVIAPACHDTASAVAAVPADGQANWCYLSSGTWSLMGAELAAPVINEAAHAASFTNERGVSGSIRFLTNIAGLWLIQQVRQSFAQRGQEHDYAAIARLAGEAKPFATLVNPAHAPFGLPGQMAEKIAEFARATGQPIPVTIGQFARCCVESLALSYRRSLSSLEKLTGRRFDVIHIVGGGGQNTLLNQMTADATGRKVVVGPFEATAAGNVLVQALGDGAVRDLAEIRRIVANSFPLTTYQPTDTSAWDRNFDRFVGLLGPQ